MTGSNSGNNNRNPKRHTLLRQWEILRLVPKGPKMVSYKQIANQLSEAGYSVDPNTVRRDLEELASLEFFPLCIDTESRPHLCYWDKESGAGLPVMDFPEALAVNMVEQYLKQLLPTALFETIRGTFSLARNTLESQKARSRAASWIDKVRSVPPVQPMAPPKDIGPDIYDTLTRAIHKEKQVKVSYRKAHSDKEREYILHPLGLILRTPSLYLAATARSYTQVLLYALHRFTKVEILDQDAMPPEGFDLDDQIRLGLADFGDRIEPIEIELLVSRNLADYLKETPLAVRGMPPLSEQTLSDEESDGRYRVKAKVNDTWQLSWWILSQGADVEVISPDSLRKSIAETLRRAAAIYGSNG